MPIYEYKCDACGFGFERIQSYSDDALEDCPRCGEAVRRVISPVGIIFKGSGWYITDSKRQLSGSKSGSRGRRQLTTDSDGDGKATAGEPGDAGKADTADASGASEKDSKDVGSADKKPAGTKEKG